jgi:hypothetical protein
MLSKASGVWEESTGSELKSAQARELERVERELTKSQHRARHLKKSAGLLREGSQVRYGFIAKHQALAGIVKIAPDAWASVGVVALCEERRGRWT